MIKVLDRGEWSPRRRRWPPGLGRIVHFPAHGRGGLIEAAACRCPPWRVSLYPPGACSSLWARAGGRSRSPGSWPISKAMGVAGPAARFPAGSVARESTATQPPFLGLGRSSKCRCGACCSDRSAHGGQSPCPAHLIPLLWTKQSERLAVERAAFGASGAPVRRPGRLAAGQAAADHRPLRAATTGGDLSGAARSRPGMHPTACQATGCRRHRNHAW